jgi:hypothetical protein
MFGFGEGRLGPRGRADAVMTLWRSRRRLGAGLGLLALVVQLALSFGHLHLKDTGLVSVAAPALAGHSLPSPQQIPPGHPDDDCPICIALHLAAAGVAPLAPSIALPSEFTEKVQPPSAVRLLSPVRYVLFRTRAPPTA